MWNGSAIPVLNCLVEQVSDLYTYVDARCSLSGHKQS